MKAQQFNRMFQKSFESTLILIGDIIPVSIGLKSPVIFLEKAEQFLEKSSLKLEAYVEGKLQRQYKKDIQRENTKKQDISILPPHSVQTQKPLDKGLSKDDVLHRLAKIDRIIMTREFQQQFEQDKESEIER